ALALQIPEASSVINQLRQDFVKISSVVDVIRKISDQTNLLALNAAIEAARAGAAWRVFSVVADEVRTLSANTHHATESIRDMIEKLQQQVNAAGLTMQLATKDAENCVSISRETDRMFQNITDAVLFIVQANSRISSA